MGTLRKLAIQKSIVCDKCEGRGGKKGSVEKCHTCRGSGIETIVKQIAPGIIQQMDQMCRHCHGNGEIIAAKDRCKQCSGKKTLRDRSILEVHVEKGMRNNQKLVFSGEGNQEPDLQPGNVVVVLEEKPHPVFKRSQNDLLMTMPLQLVEALCGFQKVIKTLDNRDLVITNLPGEVVKDEQFKCIIGEGMPHYKNPFEKGRLIIQFQVIFPVSIQPETIPQLEECLPPRQPVSIPIEAEECTMVSILSNFLCFHSDFFKLFFRSITIPPKSLVSATISRHTKRRTKAATRMAVPASRSAPPAKSRKKLLHILYAPLQLQYKICSLNPFHSHT